MFLACIKILKIYLIDKIWVFTSMFNYFFATNYETCKYIIVLMIKVGK